MSRCDGEPIISPGDSAQVCAPVVGHRLIIVYRILHRKLLEVELRYRPTTRLIRNVCTSLSLCQPQVRCLVYAVLYLSVKRITSCRT